MKALIVLMSMVFYLTHLSIIVEEFHSLDSREAEKEFIDKHRYNDHPSVKGYVCALEMKKAEYVFNPVSKLKIFNLEKRKLNQLILENQENIHLRYIRLMLQETTPSILGYRDFIESDKALLMEMLNKVDDTDYLDKFIYQNTSL